MVTTGDFHITGSASTEPPSTDLPSCSTTEFRCDDKCIPATWKCDNFDDCQDRTDEQFCGKKIVLKVLFEAEIKSLYTYSLILTAKLTKSHNRSKHKIKIAFKGYGNKILVCIILFCGTLFYRNKSILSEI